MTKLQELKDDVRVVLGHSIADEVENLNGRDYYAAFKNHSQNIGKIWQRSNHTDMSMYDTEYYLLECVWSYLVSSKAAVQNMIKYFNSIGLDPKDTLVLDVYAGCGLTTLDLLRAGFRVVNVNSSPPQIKSTKRLLEHRGFNNVETYESTTPLLPRRFDVVMCLETIEHFYEPIFLTQELMLMSSKWLVETTSFCSPQHYGHFPAYDIGYGPVTGMSASRQVHKIIGDEFEKVFSGFNGRPRIYRRK